MDASLHLKERLHSIESLERSFAASPEHYWRYAAVLLLLLLLAGLAFNAFTFWNFTWKADVPKNLDDFTRVAKLDQAAFDGILGTINQKKILFGAPGVDLPSRDPFAPPATAPKK